MAFFPLQHIPNLAEILFRQGVTDVIISPGSRNAPLIRAFYNRFEKKCRSIVDERSAGYFALGQSLATKKPAILISTSGTATLNYAPAVAEAFFQGVPLLVITADRPPEWIGQQDNQAIWQNNIYGKNIKASYSLPTEIAHPDELWFAERIINEAFHKTISGIPGPVHINVPLREPLYEKLPPVSEKIRIINKETVDSSIKPSSRFLSDWNSAKSIMLVCGQFPPDKNLQETVSRLATDNRVAVVAEPISNLHSCATISSPEVSLNSKIVYPGLSLPDLVVYSGGQVVSKKIKLFLRQSEGAAFYFISPESQIVDTFQNVTSVICAEPSSVFRDLPIKNEGGKTNFKRFWEEENQKAIGLVSKYISGIGYSDLLVFKILSGSLPEKAVVFAGNSSCVRYLSYFSQGKKIFYSNRGTSGIDGCLSTAAGLASKIEEPVFAVVGDLSFGYDSNALWNRDLPKNLKIILVNNQGGGIFHLLKGPSDSEAFMPFSNAHHPIDFKKIAEAFGLTYRLCSGLSDIETSILTFAEEKNSAGILEIQTKNNGEPKVTKDLFKFLNANYETRLEND